MAYEPRRIPTIQTLFEDEVFDGGAETISSERVRTQAYTRFGLFIKIAIAGTYTDEKLTFKVQFSNDGGTTWFTLQNDFFRSFMYTLDQGALQEIVDGPCSGRDFRLSITGAGTDGTDYFTVSAWLELYR